MSSKNFLKVAVIITSLTLPYQSQKIQAQPTCFLQGVDGQQINLGHLCGGEPSQPSVAPSSHSGIFQVPIKRRMAGIPTVEVTFNGKHTFEMLFDTGASGIAITAKMAEAIKINPERMAISGTAGGMVPVSIGRVASVKAGNLTVKNLEVGVVPTLEDMGLLGQNFYDSYDVTIKKNVIELRARR